MTLRILEESTQWANRAKLYIGIIKQAVKNDLRQSNTPLYLWDYCVQRRALIHNLVPRDLFQTEGRTPYEYQTGTQGDISNLCSYDWYDWCYFREEAGNQFPNPKEYLGRALGPSKNEGNEMAQWILKSNSSIVPRRSLRRLTKAEMNSDTERLKRNQFDQLIKCKLGDSLTIVEPE